MGRKAVFVSKIWGFCFFFTVFLLLGRLSQRNMLVFDALGIRLGDQLSFCCVYKQLGQILLIPPLRLRSELYQNDDESVRLLLPESVLALE